MKLELIALAPGQLAAPVEAPGSPGPSVSFGNGSAAGPAQSQNGASGVRSFPAMVVGALLAGCGFLFL